MADRCAADQIVIFESLAEGEFRTGRALFEDLEHYAIRFRKWKRPVYRDVESAGEFLAWLEELTREARQGTWPMVQLEMHGSQSALQFRDGSSLRWTELGNWTAKLNMATKHHLVVVVGACWGANFTAALELGEQFAPRRAPFYGFIGPRYEISGRDLYREFTSFYVELLTTGNMNRALGKFTARLDDGEPAFFAITSEDYFRRFWGHFKATELTGPARRRRLERIMTRLVEQTGTPIGELREERRHARRSIPRVSNERFEQHREFFFALDLYPERATEFPVTLDEIKAREEPVLRRE